MLTKFEQCHSAEQKSTPNGIVASKSLDNAERTLNQQLQIDGLATENLKRFENILYGPHAGAFRQIMDIFGGDYGKVDIDNDVRKNKILKKTISSNQVSSVRASYEAHNVSNQHHSSLHFFFTKKIMSKINAK